MNTLTLNFYQILDVAPTADDESLRKAYRNLARKHHPDVSSDPKAHETMARINEAFATLLDPAKRMEYDAVLSGGGLQEAPAPRRSAPQKPIVVRLKKRLSAHKTPVYSVAFTPDTNQLVSSAFDNEIIWWDEKSRARAPHQARGGNRLHAPPVRERQAVRRRFRREPDQPLPPERSEGRFLEDEPGGVGLLRRDLSRRDRRRERFAASRRHLHRTEDGSGVFRKSDHTEAVTAVAWSHDGRLIATGSADATVKLWHAANGALLHTIRQIRSTVTSLALQPGQRYLAVAGVDSRSGSSPSRTASWSR